MTLRAIDKETRGALQMGVLGIGSRSERYMGRSLFWPGEHESRATEFPSSAGHRQAPLHIRVPPVKWNSASDLQGAWEEEGQVVPSRGAHSGRAPA